MTERRFGVSTHLFHDERLTREHLVHIAAHGFELVELFATRSHFDYTDDQSVDQLAEWLSDTRLELHSLHAPICEAIKRGQWFHPFSNAATAEDRRQVAVQGDGRRRRRGRQAAVPLSRPPRRNAGRVQPCLAITIPKRRDGASRRSTPAATEHGVRVALEVMPNRLSSASALVTLLEDQLEGRERRHLPGLRPCALMGDLGEAIETLSGHLWTTHVHDNRGTRDDHLVPYSGSINWDAAIMETQKIGYEDVLMFEVASDGDPVDVLQRTARRGNDLNKAFVSFSERRTARLCAGNGMTSRMFAIPVA